MTPVSRETPGAPPEAASWFPAERLPLAERFAALLATVGVERGLIGPREAPRLWERHLINSAVLSSVVPRDATVCDVGSGAGLPGLVLAIARPDLAVTLVEPLLRRATFLTETVDALGLGSVHVERARAEDVRGRFDVVTARAVAPLARLLEWSMPLVAPAGVLLAMKGVSAEDEVAAAAGTLRRLRCETPEIVELGAGPSTARVVRVAHADPARVS